MTFSPLIEQCLALPRTVKRGIALVIDIILCVLTVWFAFYLRLGEWVNPAHLWWNPLSALAAAIFISIPVFIVSGLYRNIFRYSGLPVLLTLMRAVGVYGLIYAGLFTVVGFSGVPRTIGLIQPLLLLLAIGASRILGAFYLGGAYRHKLGRKVAPKILIYGAGSTGRQLANALASSNQMRVIGFLDDDVRLVGNNLNGNRIYPATDLPKLLKRLGVSDVLLALPSISRKRRNEIISFIRSCKVHVRTLPSVIDLAKGKIALSDIRELDIEDLLGRDAVPPNQELLRKNIANKVILVTGAGGSIGSELCRQILQQKPTKLILLEQGEFNLYRLHQELLQILANDPSINVELVPVLASVRDENRIRQVLALYHPQTIFHAAAYKHVPLVESNPVEAIENNVFGTMVMAKLAAEYQVENFTLISTDKAVRPTNVMGATKRLAEMVLQALSEEIRANNSGENFNAGTSTTFSMVRFGNVLDSSGSVVPKFKEQILQGGPLTITHPEVTRYFMTIPEAAQLVVQASSMATGGDVFLLDMGEPVRIMDLARRMIELSGLTVCDEQVTDGDIEISVIGLRPGEKLYEELLIADNPQQTDNPRIMKAHEDFIPWNVYLEKLTTLRSACDRGDFANIESMLIELVSGYSPDKGILA